MPLELPLPLSAWPVNTIDVANYTRLWTTADLDSLHSFGVLRLIVGDSYGVEAKQQIAIAAADPRFDTQSYAFVEFGDGSSAQAALDKHLAAIYDVPVSRCWLDLELSTTGVAATDVLARIQWAINYLRQRRPDVPLGIYTARWWWDIATDRSHETFGLPLMYAAYNGNGFAWDDGEAFGGWHDYEVYMKQFAGTVQTCGLNTDQSIITEYDPVLNVYTKDETDAKVGAVIKALGGQGAIVDSISTAFFGLAQHVYGSEDPQVAKLTADIATWKAAAATAAQQIAGIGTAS